jgi:hypothetical protein
MPKLIHSFAPDASILPLERPTIQGDPCENFSVRRITSRSHPCYGQFGLFAERDIGFDPSEPISRFRSRKSRTGTAGLGLKLIEYTGLYHLSMKYNQDIVDDETNHLYLFDLGTLPRLCLVGDAPDSCSLTISIDADDTGMYIRCNFDVSAVL